MELKFLQECIQANMSIRQIAEKVGKSSTTIRYWLKKYGLKTKYETFRKVDYGNVKYCSRCKQKKKVENFYNRRGKVGGSVYCKPCTLDQTLERQRKLKQKAVEYKGGECEECGYKKCNAALEFHHRDPKTKEFSLAKLRSYTFSQAIKKELDKCALLCANCHREVHDLWTRGETDITEAF